MADLIFTNNASALLAASILSTETTIQVSTGFGARFPSPSPGTTWFYLTLEDDSGNFEVCKCTARTGDLLTVTRGEDNTTAQDFTLNVTRVELRLTAVVIEQLLQLSGGTMTGTLAMNGNDITNAVLSGASTQITAGEIVGVPLRGDTGVSSNEISVPTGGGAPTIGGVAILKSNDDILSLLDTGGVISFTGATVGVTVPAGAYFRVEGSTSAEYLQFVHNDTDLNMSFGNAGVLNVTGLTTGVVLGSGLSFSFTPSGGTNPDFISANLVDFSFKMQTKSSGTTVTIDYELGSYVTVNLTSNITTLSVSNVPSGFACLRLKITQDATGGWDITNWPSGMEWLDGVAFDPTVMAVSSHTFVDIWTDDGGTTWYGGFSGYAWS